MYTVNNAISCPQVSTNSHEIIQFLPTATW